MTGAFRVLVCGGRTFTDYQHVARVLAALEFKHGHLAIIHGNARGADSMAAHWAKLTPYCSQIAFPPEIGRWPAPVAMQHRNQRMLDEGKPDLVVAFPGGRGTADMVQRARAAKVPVQMEDGSNG